MIIYMKNWSKKRKNYGDKSLQVLLNKLECHGKFIYFSNSTQIVKLVY